MQKGPTDRRLLFGYPVVPSAAYISCELLNRLPFIFGKVTYFIEALQLGGVDGGFELVAGNVDRANGDFTVD